MRDRETGINADRGVPVIPGGLPLRHQRLQQDCDDDRHRTVKASALPAVAVIVKNVLRHAKISGGNIEKEMIHEMQEFVKFSEYNIVNDHC
jgi:hypothetical protein